MRYEKHIFVCTNQRPDGAPRVSCGEQRGMEIINRFKELIAQNGLRASVRAQKAGCFDICESGPNVIVYPEGVFYGKVTAQDVDEIVKEHLLQNRPVKRLMLSFSNRKND